MINNECHKLIQRWDDFLFKIENRFYELLKNAEEAVMEHLEESNFDLYPTSRSWQAIKSQLQKLTNKIEEVFDEKVFPEMELHCDTNDFLDEQIKGNHLREKLFEKLERFEIELEGRLGLKFYDHAITFQNEQFKCSQCGATLDIKKDVFRTHYVACNYCNTTNTFKPNSKVLNIQWAIIDHIAKYYCLAEWDNMKLEASSFYAIRDKNEAKKHALQRIEDATKAYWEKFLKERIVLMSEYEKTYDKDLKAKMNSFYDWRLQQLKSS